MRPTPPASEAELSPTLFEAGSVVAQEDLIGIGLKKIEANRFLRELPTAAEAAPEPEPEPEPVPKPPEPEPDARAEKDAVFRAELAELKLSQLKKLARDEGVDEDTVDGLDDADVPKAAAIELLASLAHLVWDVEDKATAEKAEAARIAAEEEKVRLQAEDEAAEVARTAAAAEAARLKLAKDKAARVRAEKDASLRMELASLRLSQLKKRAHSEGVDEDTVDGLDDEDDPKAAAIELLVSSAFMVSDAEEEVARVRAEKEASLRVELASLKLSQLKKRARSEGVEKDAIEGLDDESDPKSAAIDLLVAGASEWWDVDESMKANEVNGAPVMEMQATEDGVDDEPVPEL